MLTPKDVESELSYAYLHAVAAASQVACQAAVRSFDNDGIDASLHVRRDFGPDATLTDITVNVQLKATIKECQIQDGRIPYWLKGIQTYDLLREESVSTHRILVVLFLPENAAEWLTQTPEQLIMQRCAWWVSLRGAPPSENGSGQTVYIPAENLLSVEGLYQLMARIAHMEDLRYVAQ